MLSVPEVTPTPKVVPTGPGVVLVAKTPTAKAPTVVDPWGATEPPPDGVGSSSMATPTGGSCWFPGAEDSALRLATGEGRGDLLQ